MLSVLPFAAYTVVHSSHGSDTHLLNLLLKMLIPHFRMDLLFYTSWLRLSLKMWYS